MNQEYNETFINDIIRMRWTYDISFNKIKKERELLEAQGIKIMCENLKVKNFKLWDKRVSNLSTEHQKRVKFLLQEEE